MSSPAASLARRAARCAAAICTLAFLLLSAPCGAAPAHRAASAASAPPAKASAVPGDLRDPIRALSQYKIDLWQTEQGLPLNTVQALLQSRDGGLWVGTAGGLARFDGKRFTTFTALQAPEIAAQPVFGLLEDAQGRLWIGHPHGALIYQDGRFTAAIDKDQTDSRRIWNFAQDKDGAVWAASENGLLRWQDGKIQRFQEKDGLPTRRLRGVAFDTAGTMWIATTGGGLVSRSVQGAFTVHNPGNGFPHLLVRQLLPDPAGGIWAATAGGGLVHIDGGTQRVYTVADGLPTDHITALTRDPRGDLWIGTWGGGVSRLRQGRFSTVSTGDGLAGSQIWSLLADREGSVWVGTWVGGLNRLRNRTFTVLGTPEGLSHDNVRSVLKARDGSLWVGTAGGGLNHIEGERITALGKADGLPSDEVSTLTQTRDGSLWIGTYTDGLARRHPDGRLETFGPAQGLPGPEVRVIFEDKDGTVWAGTRAGLGRFTGAGFETVKAPGLPAEGVSAILQTRDGTLWFGTTGQGLVQWRDGQVKTFTTGDGLLSNWIMALSEDARGSLWIGTNGEGINRYRDGRFGAVRTADGLWDGLSQTFLEDRHGHFWVTCNRGFYRVARTELDAFIDGRAATVRSVGFGPGDTVRATSFAGGLQSAGAVDAQGQVWLPSSSGLVIVDPDRLPGGGATPQVRISGISVDGQPVRDPGAGVLALPPGPVALSVSYTASTLREADRARFRFWMEGLSKRWTDVGGDRELAFPALTHGRYRLRLAVSVDGERWRESETPLTLQIRPRFHETGWFVALAGAGSLLLFAVMVRLRTRQLRQRQDDMERLVALRTEELREANEHLQRLSFSDATTGLANRRRFNEAVAEEWRRARRAGTSLGLVLADVDAFKRYNDQQGHLKGDDCLAAVASVFAEAIGRAGDLAARYGGEEFVVLLPGADHAAAMAVAHSIRADVEALEISHPASPVSPFVTISLGVAACVPMGDRTLESLLAEADAALYRAKREGRNRVC